MDSEINIMRRLIVDLRGCEAVFLPQNDLDFDSFEFIRVQLWLEECRDIDQHKFTLHFDPGALKTEGDLLEFIKFVRK